MMAWFMVHPKITPEHLGLIPGFLSEDDPRPAREQIDASYGHGGGWRPYKGFTMGENHSLLGKGDPPLDVLAFTKLRDELICYYQYSWVAIFQPDNSFEVARLD